ncbi:thioredoxin domain-containing protein [Carboxylicivirga sp. M1479]|uniref:thioredoxin family protein n=1 Tax=Carboxylicivirga sp. M1479 TaxID=2594476 RepID=UPI0011782E3D|nr:thioredoxin domain-containing protein [Carboxylicivirga sp. M1479]TRX71434.1 thioredoxin [Carboxylicivirga sp. M1479]
MKKAVLIVLAVFAVGQLFAQGIEFEHGTFNEALAKAKKENKLIFMDCYTTWCGPCKHLAKNIFTQKEVGDFYNQNFVNVKMDCEKGEGPALAKKYGVSSYPTLLFIDGEGNAVHKLVGGMPAEELIAGGKAALDPSMRIGTLRAKYEEGNRELDFLMTYLKAVKAQYDRESMQEVSREIIKQTSLEKYMNQESFFVISSANFAYESTEFKYLLDSKEKVKEIADDYSYSMLFVGTYMAHLKQFAMTCKSQEELNDEIDRCYVEFPNEYLQSTKGSLKYDFYIANNQVDSWYSEKINEVEALKGDEQYVYQVHSMCDQILNTPKLVGSKKILKDLTERVEVITADKETGLIMGNLMLAKIHLYNKEKEKAQECFDIFFAENGKAGGNNTHPSVGNLRTAIAAL